MYLIWRGQAGLVRRWMAANELKMNDAKTEVIWQAAELSPSQAQAMECNATASAPHC